MPALQTTCPKCKGSGIVRRGNGVFVVNTQCDRCGGAGVIKIQVSERK